MTHIKMIVLALIILTAAPTFAQTDCRNNLPCGGVPWRLPAMPVLRSPTPFSTIIASTGAPLVPTSTGTVTPTPSPTTILDMVEINDSLATMSVVLQATQPSLANGRAGFDLGNAGGQVVGYIVGLQDVHFGIFTPFVTFFFFAFFTIIATKTLSISVPLISAIVGVVRKIVDLILQFLPG